MKTTEVVSEKWVTVKDFPNYEVSSLGNVRNIKTGKVLKPQHNKRGGDYLFVDLRYEGKRDCVNIHNLVADAFLGRRPTDTEIHHKDLDRANPAEDNLEYKPKPAHKADHAAERRQAKRAQGEVKPKIVKKSKEAQNVR
jgi:hypothetical protein